MREKKRVKKLRGYTRLFFLGGEVRLDLKANSQARFGVLKGKMSASGNGIRSRNNDL